MIAKRHRATNTLVGLNVGVFLWELVSGTNFGSTASLVEHGALYGPFVRHGQWWRIVSGSFEHAGMLHIALNMFALYQLGMFVELVLGPGRMLVIYALSLVGGGVSVVLFSPDAVTVGASGAIFGLFGALLAIGVRLGRAGRGLIAQTLPILLINLAFTFAVPFVSKAAHVGGLVTGFCAGLALFVAPPAARRLMAVGAVDAATGEPAEAELLPPEESR